MSQTADYKAAEEAFYAGGGLRVIPLDSGSFAVYGYGSQLFGIVKKLHPSFLRSCYRMMLRDYDLSVKATEAFRAREQGGVEANRTTAELGDLDL